MKKINILFIILGLIVVTVLTAMIVKYFSNRETCVLVLPNVNEIVKIKVEQNEQVEELSDKNYIKSIMNVFSDVKNSTHKESINDYPTDVDNVIKIDFYVLESNSSAYIIEDNEEYYNSIKTIFIYERDNKYYLEQPYNGIYKLTKDEYDSINNYIFQDPLSEEIINKLEKTKSIVIKNQDNTEELKNIKDKNDIKEIIKILEDGLIWKGPYTNPGNSYNIYLLDENKNEIAKVIFDPQLFVEIDNKSYYIINYDYDKLLEIIENNLVDIKCLEDQVPAYIVSEITTTHDIDLKEISDKTVEYSKIIGTNEGGIAAIIKTKDEKVIEDFDDYFEDNYQGYKKIELKDNYKVYVYNGIKDLSLEDLRSCSK